MNPKYHSGKRFGNEADQREKRPPRKAAEVIAQLMARRGYSRLAAIDECRQVWAAAVGPALAQHSLPGTLRGGVLEIIVRNSTTAQEITFQKRTILKKLQASLSDRTIRDLRLRQGDFGASAVPGPG